MKSATIFAALALSGCVSLADVKKQEPLFDNQVSGSYSAIARCVADKMQADDRWAVHSLQYNVRVYPDIERSEVMANAHSAYTGAIYAFLLELKQMSPNIAHATLRGSKYEGPIALEALQSCSEKA